MGKAKTASKNNPTTRGSGAKVKMYSGKVVKPILYVGTQVKRGKYIAAMYDETSKLVLDPITKLPIKWQSIQG